MRRIRSLTVLSVVGILGAAAITSVSLGALPVHRTAAVGKSIATGPPASKVQWQQRANSSQAANENVPHAPKNASAAPRVGSCPVSAPALSAGLLSTVGAPPAPGVVPDTEAYGGVVGSTAYFIWAGSGQIGNSANVSGVIIVEPDSLDPCKALAAEGTARKGGVYEIPGGAVTLTTVQGSDVAFTTASGSSGTFDFVTDTVN